MRLPPFRSPASGSLRQRLFLSFVAFLLALALPFAAMFFLVDDSARKLSDMQTSQAEISGLIGTVEAAYNELSSFFLNGGRNWDGFGERAGALDAGLERLDREMPTGLHYRVYDLRAMSASFREMASSIRADWSSGMARIFIDKRLSEIARLRDYIRGELTSLLTSYLAELSSASGEVKRSLGLYRGVMAGLLALLVVAGAALAARISAGIAAPIHQLAASLERFSSGDLEAPHLPEGRTDEIGVLVAAFNRMTTEIRAHVSEIRATAAVQAELADQQRRALEAENALKGAEMRYLQAQLNPHFLYNSLNSVLSLARIEDAHRTAEAAESLTRLLRATLRSGKAMTVLGEEFDIVANYLRVQKLRFGGRLEYGLLLPERLSAAPVPAMMLQPFVENAVIHGIEPKPEGGRIEVRATEGRGGHIVVDITDDGVGFDADTALLPSGDVDEGAHIGIVNSRRRLSLLYGGDREYVAIDSAPGRGTRIRIELPLGAVAS